MDLSTYVRVGRYDLPHPSSSTAPANNVLAEEASGVTYNPVTDTLFIIGDGGRSITEVSKTGALISTMTLGTVGGGFADPEGITYIGNSQFVFTEERVRNAVLVTYQAGTTINRADALIVDLGTDVGNVGLEGLSFDPLTAGYVFAKEATPIGLFQTTINFAAGTASNGSAATVTNTNLFDPSLLGVLDLADVFAMANVPLFTGTAEADNLLVISQESAVVLEIDRAGNILSRLLLTDPGGPINIVDAQNEGITMDSAGNIYVVNENGGGTISQPELWVYAPSNAVNQAPSAIAVERALNSLPENTTTSARIKVADVAVTDDGLGNNAYFVAGQDAAFFEIDHTGLYVRTGTVLDFEAKSTYTISINVDDATVGGTPDATSAFTLTLTDDANEAPTSAQLVVSEVAPWSSGNSPVSADWFELSNNGAAKIDITGWKIDDSSHSFATALALTGITSIAPGESVIFLETADLTATTQKFIDTWFNGTAPAGLQFGAYSGGGVGLSTGGDEVNVFDSAGALKASVSFGASPTGTFTSFDNAVGLNGAAITTPSKVGVYGAFVAAGDANEIGSPGSIGRVFVSEVAPWSSGNASVGADWFEVSNTTPFVVDITGWKIDDSSESPVGAVALTGITSLAPGESVIYFETSDLAATTQKFVQTWFGGTAPTGLQFGAYSGAGVGLGTGSDAVNLYDSSNTLRSSVSFGASPTGPFTTFDNSAAANKAAVTTASAVGINGAFVAATDATQIGSPGTIGKLFISEVAPWSSGNGPVGADWFEVTNGTDAAIDLTGWKFDDSSNSFASAVALSGIATIKPGESVIFFETADLAGTVQKFVQTWFGGTAPAGLQFGAYSGGGVGLSTGGDAVNLYDASGALKANVSFGTSPTGTFATFDNTGARSGAITTLSAVGVQGGFIAAQDTTEIGSPGAVVTTNVAPVAAADTANVIENQSAIINVLGNDSDADANTLTITATSTPGNGAVVVNPNGTITYTPTTDYEGADSFTYTISDSHGGTATATVSLTVEAPFVAAQTIMTPGQSYGVTGFQGIPTTAFITGTAVGAELVTIGDYSAVRFSNNFANGGDTIRLTGVATDFTIGVSGNQITLASTLDEIEVRLPAGFADTTIIFETAPLNFADSRVLHFVADGADADLIPDLFLGAQRIFPDTAAVALFA